MPEEPLDRISSGVKALVTQGKAQGYVFEEDIEAVFEGIECDPEIIVDTWMMLREVGIEILARRED